MAADVRPWVRLSILVVGVLTLFAIARVVTGDLIPSDPVDALMFQSGLLVVVLSSSVIELNFTRPAESLVNSLSALVALIAVVPSAPMLPTTFLFIYLGIVLVASLVCVFGQDANKRDSGIATNIAYRISSELGRARIVFSVVFVTVVAFYVDEPDAMTLSLVAFWGLFLVIWPLNIPQLLNRLFGSRRVREALVGRVVRVDSPGIVRAQLSTTASWRWAETPPVLVHLPDDSVRWGIPLMSENRDDDRWGTLLLTRLVVAGVACAPGRIETAAEGVEIPDVNELLRETTGVEGGYLVGFVQEKSTVMLLRIETVPEANLALGRLLVVGTTQGPVYYQVTSAETHEEMFADLAYGSHVVSASQIGFLTDRGTFERYEWLPSMNAPVFQTDSIGDAQKSRGTDEIVLGTVPGTSVELRGRFVEGLTSHTALLGVTGSGKTEFAFDLIRHAVANGVKVIGIDLTAQYASRLKDLGPVELSISAQLAADLGDKMFEAETGTYGAGPQKAALAGFTNELAEEIDTRLKEFLGSEGGGLGLIELREISNSKATLRITELYMSSLLNIARIDGLDSKVLVVVEEAHTVMPEVSFVGTSDFDSRGTVAKISQIALQGRKFGVGLLVIAQRTATVSKSVLTQCNTVISFSCIDETSISFLGNVFGRSIAESIPQLRPLHAVAHGDWIQSNVPIAFQVEFNEGKKNAKTVPWSHREPKVVQPESDDPPL